MSPESQPDPSLEPGPAARPAPAAHAKPKLKLKQAQVWKQGDEFIRIVHLERLEVGYKVTKTPGGGEGTHHKLTKKLFCRLIKNAELVDPAAHYGRPPSGPAAAPSVRGGGTDPEEPAP